MKIKTSIPFEFVFGS